MNSPPHFWIRPSRQRTFLIQTKRPTGILRARRWPHTVQASLASSETGAFLVAFFLVTVTVAGGQPQSPVGCGGAVRARRRKLGQRPIGVNSGLRQSWQYCDIVDMIRCCLCPTRNHIALMCTCPTCYISLLIV